MKRMIALVALAAATFVPTASAGVNWGACHPLAYGGTQSAPGLTGAGPLTIVQTPNGAVFNAQGNWIGWEGCNR